MSESKLYDVPADVAANAYINNDQHAYDFTIFNAKDDVITLGGGEGVVTSMIRIGRPDAIYFQCVDIITWQYIRQWS